MNELIESGDPRAKVIETQNQNSDRSLQVFAQFHELQKAAVQVKLPKGVYRFKSHEAADEWIANFKR